MKIIKYIQLFLLPLTSMAQDYKINECFSDTASEMSFCICSDSITYDKTFGDSYRLFVITDFKSEKPIEKKIYLNLNRSADFPYELDTTYFEKYKIIIIKGCASFFLFSSTRNIISRQVFPNYSGCLFSDGQGSYISDLTINENGKILELKVNECGIHKFDISDLNKIEEI